MPRTNEEVVRRFINGETSGRANRMDIREGPIKRGGTTWVAEGETALVGYGWAIYAKRLEGGRIVVFNGWREWANDKPGHSGSTTLQHLSLVENAAPPTFIYRDDAPQCASAPASAKSMRSPRSRV